VELEMALALGVGSERCEHDEACSKAAGNHGNILSAGTGFDWARLERKRPTGVLGVGSGEAGSKREKDVAGHTGIVWRAVGCLSRRGLTAVEPAFTEWGGRLGGPENVTAKFICFAAG
jgi:hypothetical protein